MNKTIGSHERHRLWARTSISVVILWPISLLQSILSKAFDTVNHGVLIAKLGHFGSCQTALEWIESYLAGRQQVTKVGCEMSPLALMICGVPQGSISGPLLFALYVNDLPREVPDNIKVNWYADGTALSVRSFVYDLGRLAQTWFNKIKLSLNLEAIFYTILGTNPKCKSCITTVVKYEDAKIQQKTEAKYLGIILHPVSKFDLHAECLKRKSFGKIKLLGKVRPSINQETVLMLYKKLIIPIYDNYNHIYDCLNRKDSRILQRLENMALVQEH